MGRLEMDRLCEAFEAPVPSPAGGSAAAAVGAIAASLVAMVGRDSPGWPAGADATVAAVGLRDRLLALGGEDVEAVAAVLSAQRALAADGETQFGEAMVWASRVPLEIAECAAEVSVLAVDAAREGKRPMRADAEAAVFLARTATQVAVTIVAGNLGAPGMPAETAGRLGELALLASERAGIGPEMRAALRVGGAG